jgi:hypothetical protein
MLGARPCEAARTTWSTCAADSVTEMEFFPSLTDFRSLQVTPIVCSGVSESRPEGEP